MVKFYSGVENLLCVISGTKNPNNKKTGRYTLSAKKNFYHSSRISELNMLIVSSTEKGFRKNPFIPAAAAHSLSRSVA